MDSMDILSDDDSPAPVAPSNNHPNDVDLLSDDDIPVAKAPTQPTVQSLPPVMPVSTPSQIQACPLTLMDSDDEMLPITTSSDLCETAPKPTAGADTTSPADAIPAPKVVPFAKQGPPTPGPPMKKAGNLDDEDDMLVAVVATEPSGQSLPALTPASAPVPTHVAPADDVLPAPKRAPPADEESISLRPPAKKASKVDTKNRKLPKQNVECNAPAHDDVPVATAAMQPSVQSLPIPVPASTALQIQTVPLANADSDDEILQMTTGMDLCETTAGLAAGANKAGMVDVVPVPQGVPLAEEESSSLRIPKEAGKVDTKDPMLSKLDIESKVSAHDEVLVAMVATQPSTQSLPAQVQAAPLTPTPRPDPPQSNGLRSVVVASLDLADSDDEILPVPLHGIADAQVQGTEVINTGTHSSTNCVPADVTSSVPVSATCHDSDDEDDCLTSLAAPTQGRIPEEEIQLHDSVVQSVDLQMRSSDLCETNTGSAAGADNAKLADATPAPKHVSPVEEGPSSIGPPGKKAGKADTKDKKLSKQDMESKVLEYMRQQNRPYNSQNVFDNLHGVIPKGQVQVILDMLSSSGMLKSKEYGKSKVYLPMQNGSNKDCEQEAEALQAEIDVAENTLRGLRVSADGRRKAAAGLREWRDATAGVAETMREVAELEQHISVLREAAESTSTEVVDELEMAEVEKGFRVAHAEWRRRKRLCMDALRSLGEVTNAKLEHMVDTYGIDTDELCGQLFPEDAAV